MSDKTLRYEYKYVLGPASAELLRCQLGALLRPDAHARSDGGYFIRSVYFDDAALTALYDKLAGVCIRSKYRLRFYNMNAEFMVFEAKRKRGQLVAKSAVVVTRTTAERMLVGERLTAQERKAPLLAEFDALSCEAGMRPSVIVDYDRTAFVYPVSDVRVTLDSGIGAEAFRMDNVFNRHAVVPVMENGETVLEVKFSEQIPPFLAEVLSGVPKILCANSKYCNCLAMYL